MRIDIVSLFPEFREHLSYLQLKFDYRYLNTNANSTATVGYVTDLDDPVGTFVPMRNLSRSTSYVSDSVQFTYACSDLSQTYYPAIRYLGTGDISGGNNGFYIENVEVTRPDCRHVDSASIRVRPGDTLLALETGVFHVIWNGPPDAMYYNVEYWHTGASRRTSVHKTVSEPIIELEGLECMREYRFVIRTVCVNQSSLETAERNIEVPCTYYDLPYFENFEGYSNAERAYNYPYVAFNK